MSQPQKPVHRPRGAERYSRSAVSQATASSCGPTDNRPQLSLCARVNSWLRLLSLFFFFSVRVSQVIRPLGHSVVRAVATNKRSALRLARTRVPEAGGVSRRLKGVWPAAVGTRTAGMPRYAQLVMGPAGSGKVRLEEPQFVGGGTRGTLGNSLPLSCTLFLFGSNGSLIVVVGLERWLSSALPEDLLSDPSTHTEHPHSSGLHEQCTSVHAPTHNTYFNNNSNGMLLLQALPRSFQVLS